MVLSYSLWYYQIPSLGITALYKGNVGKASPVDSFPAREAASEASPVGSFPGSFQVSFGKLRGCCCLQPEPVNVGVAHKPHKLHQVVTEHKHRHQQWPPS